MKTLTYALIICSVMVGKAGATTYDYPPPQYTVDKLVLKTSKVIRHTYHVTSYSWYCTTKNRINYRCYLTASRNGKLVLDNARFRVTVKKGYRTTKLYEDISGTFNVNHSRYGVLTPLDW